MANLWTPDEFFWHLVKGYHGDMNAAAFRIALVAAANAPTKAGSAVLADLTQIAATDNGYTAVTSGGAGQSVTLTWAETGGGTGIWQLGTSGSDATFTQAGANSLGPFRYACLINTSTTTVPAGIVAVLDYGSDVTLVSGQQFVVDAGANGWARFTTPAWT